MRITACLLVLSGAAYFTLPVSAADQVNLKDGTVLRGKIGGLSEGKLALEASFGGALSIPWAEVTGLQSDDSVAFILQDGSKIQGTPKLVEGVQQLYGAPSGAVPLSLSSVTSLALDAPPADASAAAPAPPLEGSEPPAEAEIWVGRAELGLNGQTGNKERFDVRAGVDMNRKAEAWRLNLYLKGQYAETNSEQSANEVMGGTRAEWDISERTYVFGKLDLEHDEFEDLEVRATATTGLGHFFVKREKLELKGWLGAGYEHETFKKDPEPVPDDLPTPTTLEESIRQILLITRQDDTITTTTDEVVAEAGYSYQQDLRKNFRLKHGITYYPSVDDPFQQYRVTADTSMEFPVGKEPDWTVRAGVRNEYDAAPQEEVDKLDTTYYLNLGYNF